MQGRTTADTLRYPDEVSLDFVERFVSTAALPSSLVRVENDQFILLLPSRPQESREGRIRVAPSSSQTPLSPEPSPTQPATQDRVGFLSTPLDDVLGVFSEEMDPPPSAPCDCVYYPFY